jgi:2,3-bisphosphoglycerate-dependent phosphoglycerate mutase
MSTTTPVDLPPEGVRTVAPQPTSATRVVLVRHGEAVCNVSGVIGGLKGCSGLTERGVAQAHALADRLARTGELGNVTALYSSVLPRARQTAQIIRPALEAWGRGPLDPVALDELCELHPGEADGLSWSEFTARYPVPDWDNNPDQPVAPGAESWTRFVERASDAVSSLADAHPGGLVVAACHAGVVEASLLRLLPARFDRPRLGLRTLHASMTVWESTESGWLLLGYNDATPINHDGPAPALA